MKIRHSYSSRSAFTMVEIAIALGVIAFALVAIVGILPTGLNVEKENREETLINQDGPYFLEAIRSGARGLDILTNFVDSITITATGSNNVQSVTIFTNSPGAAAPFDGRMTDSHWILGLMSRPKYLNGATNRIDARVHAMSGAAVEQSKGTREMGFAYSIFIEIVPINFHAFQGNTNGSFAADAGSPFTKKIQDNLYEVKLNFRWPLLPNGDVGPSRKIYRTYISGQVKPEPTEPELFFCHPDSFAKLQ